MTCHSFRRIGLYVNYMISNILNIIFIYTHIFRNMILLILCASMMRLSRFCWSFEHSIWSGCILICADLACYSQGRIGQGIMSLVKYRHIAGVKTERFSAEETAHRFLKILYPSGQLNKWWPMPEFSTKYFEISNAFFFQQM